MEQLRELARLNLVLELVTECASLADADAIAPVVATRLRWILDYDRCEIALASGSDVSVTAMGSSDDALLPLARGLAAATGGALIERALGTSAPASSGRPISAIAYPLGPVERPLGALFVSAGSGSFSHRELRLLQHICSSLGGVLARIQRDLAFEAQRRDTAAREETSRRERAARDEAVTANAAKDDFLAMLGHELRNPLAPILLCASSLRRELTGKQLARVEVILRQVRHLDRLVSDLLDISRVTSGRVNLQRVPTDLREVANKAAEMVRPGMDKKQQALKIEAFAELAMVDGDEVRLTQVLVNLLNNASLYSPTGSPVLLEISRLGSELVVSVTDEGIGMSDEIMATAFDMFIQGKRSQELGPGGLGLGLSVARALAEVHGGRITAESDGEGRGSRFRMWLPAAPEQTISAELPPPIARISTEARVVRILVVDDNADLADAVGEALLGAGHDVRIVYTPEKAIELVHQFFPQVAVLDIGLPTMDGYQLAERLRALLPEPPRIIAVSGFGQQRDREKSQDQGFQAHFVKPADIQQLLAAIEDAEKIA